MVNPRLAVQRATFEAKALPLYGEWAYKVACEKFGQDLVDSFPRYSRGPRKGKLKGLLCYFHASEGGWASLPRGRGVLFRGTSDWKLTMAPQYSDPKEHSIVARWHRHAGVEVLQTPADAERNFKIYGQDARYG